MCSRYLVILEVSQKQNYIFSHRKLQNNMIASDVIRYVTNKAFFNEVAKDLFSEEKNMVYDGGGHTILEFPTNEAAKAFVSRITETVLKEFPDVDIFAKIEPYDDNISPKANEENLIKSLEIKKSLRRASFHQGKYGIEAENSRKTAEENSLNKETTLTGYRDRVKCIAEKEYFDSSRFETAYELKNLGGKENESNFIAIIHIDGNLMGKRVKELNAPNDWNEYKEVKRKFSDAIDRDFKSAYEDMTKTLETEVNMKKLTSELNIEQEKKMYFPVRKIIAAGDDICFVTEGRIGLECARIFLQHINSKVNEIDGKNYSACAGVAIVHQKYPFYRAYDMAEQLCANAKRYITSLSDGKQADVCAIDWHIEFGEMIGGLSEIRKSYINKDGYSVIARPYHLCGNKELRDKDPVRDYAVVKQLIISYQNGKDVAARSKLKMLRTYLKDSEAEAKAFVNYNLLDDTIYKTSDISGRYGKELFYETFDDTKHSIIFDALEVMDTFISLEG